jgi:hypothetical protein
MSPFSVERQNLTGESYHYLLEQGPFPLSLDPEKWIVVRDDDHAELEMKNPDSGKENKIVLRRTGVVVYDASRQETVSVRWSESPKKDVWRIIWDFEEKQYHPFSAKMNACFSNNLQELRQIVKKKKGPAELAEFAWRISFNVLLLYSIPLADLFERVVFFPRKFQDMATRKLEKMLEESADF